MILCILHNQNVNGYYQFYDLNLIKQIKRNEVFRVSVYYICY